MADQEELRQSAIPAAIAFDNVQLCGQAKNEIEERVGTTTALRESEQRYRQLVHGLPVAVYTCDAEGRVTLYNKAAVELWGREPELGKDLWCDSWRIYRPDGTPLSLDQCPMAVALKEGRPVSGEEIVIERPDGTYRNILPHPHPIRDASGAIIGAVNTLIDITGIKRTDRALRESEERVRRANSELERQVRKLQKANIEIQDSRRAAINVMEDAVHARQLVENLNTELRKENAQRRKAEEASAGLAAIVNSSDDAIVGKTLDGIITSWNPGAERIFGYTAAEAIGQHITFIIPEERRAEEDQVLAHIRRGEKVDHFQTVRQNKDGQKIDISLTVSPIRNAEGRVIGASKVARDITARKRAEMELQRLNDELERRVFERTAELISTIEQREKLQEQLLQAQKMESIGTLAGGIAHDFNNLLNIIMGYTLLIQHDGYKGKLSEAMDVIKETVQRAAALVQQLLSIARKTEVRFQESNINAILEKLKMLLTETFPKTIDITLKLDSQIPPLILDPNQLHQVLLNLCVNARDAMPDGGSLVLQTSIVDGAKLREQFSEAKNGPYVCISVADKGGGIHRSIKNRIFEPFFTTKASGEGTGLGLSVVYGIVTNHSGFVDVESEPGQGTTFFLYLPIAQDNPDILEPDQKLDGNVEKASGNGELVLFVDDEQKQLRLMREFLESEGYRVLTAGDGAEAVETHARHRDEIAIVLLDLGLPKLNGWQAFQRMREINPKLNVLFATGFLSPEIDAAMRRDKLAGVINKPYQLSEVLEKISAAVSGRE